MSELSELELGQEETSGREDELATTIEGEEVDIGNQEVYEEGQDGEEVEGQEVSDEEEVDEDDEDSDDEEDEDDV